MPIFEYKCKNCGCEFEVLQLGKNEKVNCKKCGSKKLNKLISCFAYSSSRSSGTGSGSSCDGCSGKNCSMYK